MKSIKAATMTVPLFLAAASFFVAAVAESSAAGSSAGSTMLRSMEAAEMESAVAKIIRQYLEQTVNVPYNLAGLEASLLAMAREGTVSPNMEPWLQEIEGLTAQMKTQVVERKKLTQTLLDKAWLPLLQCTLQRGDVQEGTNMDTLNVKHRECSKTESEEFNELLYCQTEMAAMKNRTTVSCEHLQIYEGNWPISCYEPDVSRYTTASDIIDNLVSKFEELSNKWNATNKSCVEANATYHKKIEECRGIELRYNSTFQKCSNMQEGMESIGCGNGTGACAEYINCWNTHYPLWMKQTEASQTSQAGYHAEYKSILRIDCLVDAFRLDIAGTQDLTTGVNTCKGNTYNTSQWLQNASITIYPQDDYPLPAFIYCNESSAGPSKPGTQAWYDFYCNNLPQNTKCEKCSSSCCDGWYGKTAA